MRHDARNAQRLSTPECSSANMTDLLSSAPIRRLRRSKLFVPGNRPEIMRKAAQTQADMLSLDLEDAVPPAQKVQARADVAAFVADPAHRAKEIVVRINARDTGLMVADLLAIGAARPHLINVPKVEDERDLHLADDLLAHIEAEHGWPIGGIGLMPTLESPRGIRRAAQLCGTCPRVVAVQFGMGDLRARTGMSTAIEHLRPVRAQIMLAAAEAGIDALDGAYPDITDLAGFMADATEANSLGFRGKSCIHPSQIEACNSAFGPSEAEIEDARALLLAFDEAQSRGVGAIRFRGRLVDEVHRIDAHRLLGLAGRGDASR
jgi:citrate lyase subunit beta/citryl-CoA lyase